MKTKIALLALLLTFGTSSVFAADAAKKKVSSPAQKAQQDKMKACNADAGKNELKGDDRKKFMSECLSAKKSAPATQQNKMKSCNATAGEKKITGGERKKFMSECLKSDAKAPAPAEAAKPAQ